MSAKTYNVFAPERGVPIKAWTRGVSPENEARNQLLNVAQLPFVYIWIAAMPDVHCGIGATLGSVIPSKGAIIPAAVGVDIGCGMMAVETSLNARDLPGNLKGIREAIEKAVPHGRTNNGGAGDRGAESVWFMLQARIGRLLHRAGESRHDKVLHQLAGHRPGPGLCAVKPAVDDGADRRGGAQRRRDAALQRGIEGDQLPSQLRGAGIALRPECAGHAKGRGPGARSYIVRGEGNPESFHSCSHGAGRASGARKRSGGLKDLDVDETPAAYKPIDQVMAAQSDLVEIVRTLRQVVCVKG
jgi:RNA-splicing ligase RtcB